MIESDERSWREWRNPALIVVCCAALALAFYSRVTVEDAFISLRYARNFANGDGLVFNYGEPVSAMTSPLHVLLMTPSFWIVDDAMAINKILGLFAGVTSALIAASQFRDNPGVTVLVFAAAFLPAPILFWSVAGLETPLLALAIAIGVVLVPRAIEGESKAYLYLCLVAGAAFLLRYDSVVFFAPVLLTIGLRRFSYAVVRAWIVGAALPLAWLALSRWYFGDFLPSSYYVKTPGVGGIFGNAFYILTFLTVTGVAPVAVLLFLIIHRRRDRPDLATGILLLGLSFVLMYGLLMARTHMMFQMRFFAPYFAVLAFASGLHLKRLGSTPKPGLIAAVTVLVMASVISVVRVHSVSVNGFAINAEYRNLSVTEYVEFIEALEVNANDIKQHWDTLGIDRQLRIKTFAAGVVPYRLPKSYIFESLVSYRHTTPVGIEDQFPKFSDYLHILAPRHGSVEEQTQLIPEAVLVSDVPIYFDGNNERSLVYWNGRPLENPLPERVDGPYPRNY